MSAKDEEEWEHDPEIRARKLEWQRLTDLFEREYIKVDHLFKYGNLQSSRQAI
jgi:hypothetical protein